jgi:hypothetical protein
VDVQTSALSGSLPLAEGGADDAMGKDDDTVTYFNSTEDDQTRPDVGKADEASGMVAKMGLTKFLSKKVPAKKFEDPKGQEPAPMPVEEEEVEAFDFKGKRNRHEASEDLICIYAATFTYLSNADANI